jgi:hypothetical protein
MALDGSGTGTRMAIDIIGKAFSMLATDFATVERDAALASLGRIELAIADALSDFRLQNPERTGPYDDAFHAMLHAVCTLVEDAGKAVKAGGGKTE